jgi:elongation factor Ts
MARDNKMIEITAAMVKELRERTNAGMMECKKALVEANGNIESAIQTMREKKIIKGATKEGRITAEGTIVVLGALDGKSGIVLEVNCETDFVSRGDNFKQFAKRVGEEALAKKLQSLEAVQAAFDARRLDLISEIGENISIRRFVYQDGGVVGTYGHGDANGVRIGALVVLKKGTVELAKELAMQVAAMNPEYVSATDVPADRVTQEKDIYKEHMRSENKPEAMVEKILEGKLKKFVDEISLLGQPFVKDPSKTIASLLKETNSEIETFVRFAVGEGIEKKEDNFAEEVMAQVKG